MKKTWHEASSNDRMDSVRNWYLVHTKPRKESVAEENLERQGYEVYLPLIHRQRRRYERWVQIIEPLFPRYLFIHLQPGYDNMAPVRYTSGVQNFVRFTEEPALWDPYKYCTKIRQTSSGCV